MEETNKELEVYVIDDDLGLGPGPHRRSDIAMKIFNIPEGDFNIFMKAGTRPRHKDFILSERYEENEYIHFNEISKKLNQFGAWNKIVKKDNRLYVRIYKYKWTKADYILIGLISMQLGVLIALSVSLILRL